jgi:hypothetical protein
MARQPNTADSVPEAPLGPRPRLLRRIIKGLRSMGASPVRISFHDMDVLVHP